MKIKHHSLFNTEKVCEHYSEKDGVPIKYVCTSALAGEEFARDIFYRETPHPEFGNKYFAIHEWPPGQVWISNADKIEDVVFDCIENPDTGEWEYSQHRHDYRQVGAVAIDGGRSYTRLVGDLNVPVKPFRVKDGEFIEDIDQ